MRKRSMFVGMDVHSRTIDITVAEEGRTGKVWHFGCIAGDLRSVDRAVDKLLEYGRPLHFVYEAGPCGFVLYRHLRDRGLDCTVVSPAHIPRKPSDRIKTDRRDSRKLATTHRAGQLRCLYVPEPEDEAIRDLVRAREDAVNARKRARQQLNSFCLRHGRHYTRSKWTQVHRRWLSDQIFELPAERIVFEESILAIEEGDRRIERLERQIESLLANWRFRPVVEALQALRGVSMISAATLVAELGDLTRLGPRDLMNFLGLVVSEHTSSNNRRQGGITKTGNAHVRRVLCEAAWSYDNPPALSRHLRKRQEHLSPEIREVAWKAQLRLCHRFRHLSAARKHRNKVNVAVARELCGFIWKIATLAPIEGKEIRTIPKRPRHKPGRYRVRVAAPAA